MHPRSAHVEPCAKRVRIVFGGVTVADSTDTLLVWEHTYYPQYYVPRQDVQTELLSPESMIKSHELLGDATQFTLHAGDRQVAAAAWQYTASPIEAIRDFVRFDWSTMDSWHEEDEEIFVHPRNPYARIDVLDSSRHVRVAIDGVVIADSTRPTVLFETHMPTRFYVAPDDVRMDLLTATDTISRCPYKGVARYWKANINGDAAPGDTARNIVWSYPTPVAEVARIAGLMCFYDSRVQMIVDGKPSPMPPT